MGAQSCGMCASSSWQLLQKVAAAPWSISAPGTGMSGSPRCWQWQTRASCAAHSAGPGTQPAAGRRRLIAAALSPRAAHRRLSVMDKGLASRTSCGYINSTGIAASQPGHRQKCCCVRWPAVCLRCHGLVAHPGWSLELELCGLVGVQVVDLQQCTGGGAAQLAGCATAQCTGGCRQRGVHHGGAVVQHDAVPPHDGAVLVPVLVLVLSSPRPRHPVSRRQGTPRSYQS